MVNVRLPLPLLAHLDRDLDRLARQTGLQANRGMSARRALARLVASHASESATGSAGSHGVVSPITAMVAPHRRGDGPLSPITGTRIPWRPACRLVRRDSAFLTMIDTTESELSDCLHNSQNWYFLTSLEAKKTLFLTFFAPNYECQM